MSQKHSLNFNIPILFDHPNFVVVNKPVGVEMHDPDAGICQLLKQQYQFTTLLLAHRLDKDTSGCLVLAKNKASANSLAQQFAARLISKLYIAISDKKPKKKQGKVQGLMKKARNGSYMLTRTTTGNHNVATTFFLSQSIEAGLRLFYIKPISGKTHQIRVALKSLGSPILGDARYKAKVADRLYLHSWCLGFQLDNENYSFSCLPQSGLHFSKNMLSTVTDPKNLDWPEYKPPNTSNHFEGQV